MPTNEPYQLLHTASMVGLFSCIFVKASQRDYIDQMNAAELKRGLGGLHGNKVDCTPGTKMIQRLIGYVRVLSYYASSLKIVLCA